MTSKNKDTKESLDITNSTKESLGITNSTKESNDNSKDRSKKEYINDASYYFLINESVLY